jgi:hypothetical protein
VLTEAVPGVQTMSRDIRNIARTREKIKQGMPHGRPQTQEALNAYQSETENSLEFRRISLRNCLPVLL